MMIQGFRITALCSYLCLRAPGVQKTVSKKMYRYIWIRITALGFYLCSLVQGFKRRVSKNVYLDPDHCSLLLPLLAGPRGSKRRCLRRWTSGSGSLLSALTFARWSQGFQMTVSGKLYFWMRILRPDTTLVTMCSPGVWMYTLEHKQSSNRKYMSIISDEMRSSLVVRASDCQCTRCSDPGFHPSICRHSGIWGAADEAVLNVVRKKIPIKNI